MLRFTVESHRREHSPRLSAHGFTLIELLVAVSITAIMLFLINQIYNQAVGAVRKGVQTADVIASHRGMSDQIERDFRNMVPPGPAGTPGLGFMAILHREVPNIPGAVGVRMPDPTGGTGFTDERLRTDQLLFIRYASDQAITSGVSQVGDELLESATPLDAGELSPPSNARADYARVWYGHLDYTNEDGSPSTDTLVQAGNLGSSGLMNNGWNWMLGRHALLLVGPQLISNTTGAWINWPGNVGRANGFNYDSDITNINMTPLPASDEKLWVGATDRTVFGLHSDQAWGPTPASPTNTILGTGSSPPAGYTLSSTVLEADYEDRVLEMTFATERLKANPNPPRTLRSWEIGQMHPIAMVNVSDFIIDFAADAHNDASIAGYPDGTPDIDLDGDGVADNSGGAGTSEIVWYGLDNPPPYDGALVPPDPAVSGATLAGVPNADAGFVFRHDGRDAWPYLIRMRYRVHDTRGDLTSTVWGANDGKDNDGDGAVDEADEARDFPINGKWFEVIVPVDRGSP